MPNPVPALPPPSQQTAHSALRAERQYADTSLGALRQELWRLQEHVEAAERQLSQASRRPWAVACGTMHLASLACPLLLPQGAWVKSKASTFG